MFFQSNSVVSIADIMRRFRIHDYVVDTWMLEVVIPRCVLRNGHRYWSGNELNALIGGCLVTFSQEAASSTKKS
jgi:hypothetical protein